MLGLPYTAQTHSHIHVCVCVYKPKNLKQYTQKSAFNGTSQVSYYREHLDIKNKWTNKEKYSRFLPEFFPIY